MKWLTNIFEGIFDQNTDRLENRAMLDDPNSAFNKEWADQIFTSRFKKFEILDNLLNIGVNTIGNSDPLSINYRYPLLKYLPDINGIHTDGILHIYMRNNILTPDKFGNIISSYQYIYIDKVPSIRDMRFIATAGIDINPRLDVVGCMDFVNCIFDGITGIKIDYATPMSNFIKCKSNTLHRIEVFGNDVFKNSWPEFENLIDYDRLELPVNKQTGKPVSARIMNLPKMASIMKYRHKYSWENYKEIPLTTSGQNIVKKLFPSCNFPHLESINITGSHAFLCINIKKNLCFMMSRTGRPR